MGSVLQQRPGWRRGHLSALVTVVVALGVIAALRPTSQAAQTAEPRVWTALGPGIESIRALASDGTGTVLYAGTTRGVFKSIDKGGTWTNTGLNQNVGTLAVSENGAIVLAGTGDFFISGNGLWRSVDGGTTWAPSNTGLTNLTIHQIAIRGNDAWVASKGGPTVADGGTLRSTNGGVSWEKPGCSGSVTGTTAFSITIDPDDAGNVLTGAGSTLYQRYIHPTIGECWRANWPGSFSGTGFAWGGAGVVYAAHASGILRSTDSGVSWTPVHSGLTTSSERSVRSVSANGNSVLIGTAGGVFQGDGTSWTRVGGGMPVIRSDAVLIDPSNPMIRYAGTISQGIFKSTDGGMTWKEANNGLLMTGINTVAVQPGNPNRIVIGATGGAFYSTDAGAHWMPSSPVDTVISKVVFDPQNPMTVYAVACGSSTNINCVPGEFIVGIWKSTDGGQSFTTVTDNLPSGPTRRITDVAVNPLSPSTVYIATTTQGIWKSTSGGGAWTQMNTGLPTTSPGPFQRVNAVLPDAATANLVFAGTAGAGIYTSTDGGGNWTASNTGLTNLFVNALVQEPGAPATLYAGTSGGVFISNDGGATWTARSNGLTNTQVRALAIDPRHPNEIQAATGSGVFTSVDRGLSWTLTSAGNTTPLVNAVAYPTTGPEVFYAATAGGVFKNQVPPLAVTGLDPFAGPVEGGTTVTIFGTRFDTMGGTAVTFGTEAATMVNCPLTTRCTAVSPPGSLGSVHVTVTVGNQTSEATDADFFTYRPKINGISPHGGPPAGGTVVTITGTGFSTTPNAVGVLFGNAPATNVSCSSTTTCTATTPPGTGTVPVRLFVLDLQSIDNTASTFAYILRQFSARTSEDEDVEAVEVGETVQVSGEQWDAQGGPIEVLWGDSVVYSTAAAASWSGQFKAPRFVTRDEMDGCRSPLRARQDGVEQSITAKGHADFLTILGEGPLFEGPNPQWTVGEALCRPERPTAGSGVHVAVVTSNRGLYIEQRQFPGTPISVRGGILPGDGHLCLALSGGRMAVIRPITRPVSVTISTHCFKAPRVGASHLLCPTPGGGPAVPTAPERVAGPAATTANRINGMTVVQGTPVCFRSTAVITDYLRGVGSVVSEEYLIISGTVDLVGEIVDGRERAETISLGTRYELLLLGPQPVRTALSAPAGMGSTALAIANTAGFDVGDLIRIDPGGPNQEDATVSALGSLILAAPLQRNHAEGELVVRLSNQSSVRLQGREADFPAGVGHSIATVTLRRPDSTIAATTPVAADGSYTLNLAGVADGSYTLHASADGYLPASRPVTVNAGAIADGLGALVLYAGLVDGDQSVTITDVNAVIASFGKSVVNRRDAMNRIVDQNGDGVVNLRDLSLVLGNFGRSGAQVWPSMPPPPTVGTGAGGAARR